MIISYYITLFNIAKTAWEISSSSECIKLPIPLTSIHSFLSSSRIWSIFFNGDVEHFLFIKVAVLDLFIVVVFGVLAEHSLNAKTVAVLKRFSKEIVPSVVLIRHIQQYVYQSQFFFLCCGVGIVACQKFLIRHNCFSSNRISYFWIYNITNFAGRQYGCRQEYIF